jgi:hypothetical protein
VIDELERMERAATPGEWKPRFYGGPDYLDGAQMEGHLYAGTEWWDDTVLYANEADLEFIAAARNALPALLRAIKAGRECADDLESVLRARYEGTLDYPSQAQRFERDMEPVRALRAALAALEGAPDA